MRLIDADALESDKFNRHFDDYAFQVIDNAPTIDTIKRGHWIVLQNRAVESICYWSEEQKKADKKGAGIAAKCKCSNCNWRTNFMGYVKTGIENMFNYCPNCGAKMDEVTDNERRV